MAKKKQTEVGIEHTISIGGSDSIKALDNSASLALSFKSENDEL